MRFVRRSPSPTGSTASGHARRRSRGQSLVEFALIFTPLMLIFMALAQFGFIFNAYITMATATREGARIATIYPYDRLQSKAQNDTARNNLARTTLLNSFNQLTRTAPNFTSSSTWTSSGLTWTTGDLTVVYEIPTGVVDTDPRAGQRITVRGTYHLTLFIPLVASLLPRDAGGRIRLTTETTMVIN